MVWLLADDPLYVRFPTEIEILSVLFLSFDQAPALKVKVAEPFRFVKAGVMAVPNLSAVPNLAHLEAGFPFCVFQPVLSVKELRVPVVDIPFQVPSFPPFLSHLSNDS